MKGVRLRPIAILLAFAAVVAYVVITPFAGEYVSNEDILSVTAGTGGIARIIDTRGGIAEFMDWLELTVPREDIYFVREEYPAPEGARAYFVVDQVPDKMTGLSEEMEFKYSIYHMYICVLGDKLYFNGVEFDFPPEAEDYIAGGM